MSKQNIEVEVQPMKKAAKVLNNKARAMYQGRGLIVAPAKPDPSSITTLSSESQNKSLEQMGQDIHRIFREPFKRRVTDGAILYNTTQKVTLSADRQPVLPPEYETTVWRLTYDGQLQIRRENYDTENTDTLRTPRGDALLADGAAADPVNEFRFQYYKRADGGDTVVETADGDVVASTETGAEINEWTTIYFPHVPVDVHYLHDTTIYYRERDMLREVTVESGRMRSDDTVTERVTSGIEEFINRYTVSVDNTELRKDEFVRVFRRWYAELTDTEPPARETIGTGLKRLGWGRETGQKRRKVSEEAGQEIFMDGMTWRIPRQIYSPEHPFVETDD